MNRSRLLPIALFSLAACGSEFDPVSRVTDFRLIAVRADKPFAAPGDTVTLTTLSHEPFGRPVTWAWGTCVLPSSANATGCLQKIAEDDRSGRRKFVLDQGVSKDTQKITLEKGLLDDIPAKERGGAIVGVLTVGCPGTLGVKDLSIVAEGKLPFSCADANTGEDLPYDRWVVSVKRIFLRETDQNQNPPIAEVQWNGAAWPEGEIREITPCSNDANAYADCEGGEEAKLSVLVPSDAYQSGTDETGKDFEERVVVQYYAGEGSFEFDVRDGRTPETSWKARKNASGKVLPMWFVARDDRGGVSFTTRQVKVR